MSEVKTFRGLSLAEVEAKVRAELGDDAVIVRQREGLSGGVGGFFQRRIFEVDATGSSGVPAPKPQVQLEQPVVQVAPAPAEDFAAQLKAALAPEFAKAAAEQQLAAEAAAEFIPEPPLVETAPAAPAPAKSDAAALAALFAPDAQRAPVEWPEEEPEPVATPLPEPEILPA